MRLTMRTDHGLRALLYLTLHPERVVPIPEIADAYRISQHHLAKVGRNLVQLGWAESLRGKNGGLRLAAGANKLTLGQVVRELESWTLVECFGPGEGSCPIPSACGIRKALAEAQGAFVAALDRYSLADLAAERTALVELFASPRRATAAGGRLPRS